MPIINVKRNCLNMPMVNYKVSESILGVPEDAFGCLGVPRAALGCSLGEKDHDAPPCRHILS